MEINWAEILDPANGGPGEAPGYQEALRSARQRNKEEKVKPKRKPARRRPKSNRRKTA